MTEKMFDLTGKVALVTGANSGLGFAFAEGMARAGSDLVIWGRRKDANDKAAEKLRAFGVKVHSAEVDVTDEAQIVAGVADAAADPWLQTLNGEAALLQQMLTCVCCGVTGKEKSILR